MVKSVAAIDFIEALSFRIPMEIREIHLHRNNMALSVCPRCRITLEREYQSYCDRCGQALNWKHFSRAAVVLIE